MDKLWHFLNITLDVFPFIFLQYLPFRDKLKFGYVKTILICTAVMVVQFFGFVWLTGQAFYTQDIMLLYRFGSIATLLVMTVIFVRDHFAKVYFVFGLMTPYVMATIASGSYFSFLFRPASSPVYMYTSMFRATIIAATFPFVYLLAKKYLLPAMKIGDEKMWRYALPVPVMFSLICIFFVDPLYEFNGVTLKALFGMLFVFFGCIFTCYFLLKALHQVQEKTELAEREKQSRELLAMQGEHYKLIAENIESTRAARHDLRHHLADISSLIDNTQSEKLKTYIAEYIEAVSLDSELMVCENHTVNAIAGYYIRLAKQQGIETSFVFGIDSEITVADTDLCVIVGNTMENAIEACNRMETGKRFIRVRAKVIDDNFSFTCDNSFDGEVLRDGEDYLSRKRNGAEKGVGLSSVAAVVKKYNGIMNVQHTGDTFMVSVLLVM